jgi:hypothetical protein
LLESVTVCSKKQQPLYILLHLDVVYIKSTTNEESTIEVNYDSTNNFIEINHFKMNCWTEIYMNSILKLWITRISALYEDLQARGD